MLINYLSVQQQFTRSISQYPRLIKGNKQNFSCHGNNADAEITNRQIDNKDVHSTVELSVFTARQHDNYDDVTDQGRCH